MTKHRVDISRSEYAADKMAEVFVAADEPMTLEVDDPQWLDGYKDVASLRQRWLGQRAIYPVELGLALRNRHGIDAHVYISAAVLQETLLLEFGGSDSVHRLVTTKSDIASFDNPAAEDVDGRMRAEQTVIDVHYPPSGYRQVKW